MNQPTATPDLPPVRCPFCGGVRVAAVRKNYDGGLGCLGLILFGWMGLLLGLLGGNDIEMYCQDCGHRWDPRGRGCFSGCFTVAAAILAAMAVIFLVMLILAAIVGSL